MGPSPHHPPSLPAWHSRSLCRRGSVPSGTRSLVCWEVAQTCAVVSVRAHRTPLPWPLWGAQGGLPREQTSGSIVCSRPGHGLPGTLAKLREVLSSCCSHTWAWGASFPQTASRQTEAAPRVQAGGRPGQCRTVAASGEQWLGCQHERPRPDLVLGE